MLKTKPKKNNPIVVLEMEYESFSVLIHDLDKNRSDLVCVSDAFRAAGCQVVESFDVLSR